MNRAPLVVMIALGAGCAARTPPPAEPILESGSILGSVRSLPPEGFFRDAPSVASELAIAGVVVTATSTALETPRRTTSDDRGFYQLVDLPAGIYTLHFERTDGPPLRIDNVEVRGGTVRPIFVTMQRAEPEYGPICVYYQTCTI